eukprot:15089587-Ditylum_brightwellii.AAC.1
MVTTFSSRASSAVRPLRLPNWTGLIRRDILELAGSFSNMMSTAICHRLGEKPRRKGKTIIVAWTRLMLSDKSAPR